MLIKGTHGVTTCMLVPRDLSMHSIEVCQNSKRLSFFNVHVHPLTCNAYFL